jgi:ferredoxin
VQDAAIVYDDIDSVADIPVGYIDEQDGGHYRIKKTGDQSFFDYVVGPTSLKRFLFPPRETILESSREDGKWQMAAPAVESQPLAVIGVRSCDLHALAIQDRIFLGDQYVDTAYETRRDNLLVIAVNCRRAADTCFCHSMKTGPAVKSGFDLALTERSDHFVVEVGTEIGGHVIAGCDWSPCAMADVTAAQEMPAKLKERMVQRSTVEGDAGRRGRHLDTDGIKYVLLNNLEHPRWEQVAERCLACSNCTMVCPTCFCSSVEDVSDLTGDRVRRDRAWASCFTAEHSYMNSGTVRKSTTARYRQWLTHKLASWIDQFGTSGCTGCGRCITWCPVGIDLTEEVAAIRGDQR